MGGRLYYTKFAPPSKTPMVNLLKSFLGQDRTGQVMRDEKRNINLKVDGRLLYKM